jgi:parallel beta-helix repeat protein
MLVNYRVLGTAVLLVCLSGCYGPVTPSGTPTATPTVTYTDPSDPKNVIHVKPGANVQEEVQTALIKAKPGDIIEFAAGTYEFTQGLSLAVENVTLRGQGIDKTILSFKKQEDGKEGLLVSRDRFTIEGLSIQDTRGDAVKVNKAENITFRKVKAEWTGEPSEKNGAYGIYPVQCTNVLIEDCISIGASDAGIYVGQSKNVIIRRCKAEKNVAGIEIENCTDAEAYENEATNNAGGLLVFDLPGLPVKNGQRIKVHHNKLIGNNHANFAAKGNMVATVAPGTGLLVMASHQVEIYKNTIKDNKTYGLGVISFLLTGKKLEDDQYDPIPEAIFVHDNTFEGNGQEPTGEQGQLLAMLVGSPMPEIIYDGIVKGKDKPAREQGVYFKNNGSVTVVNLHWGKLDLKDLEKSRRVVERNPKELVGELPPLPPVKIPGVQ